MNVNDKEFEGCIVGAVVQLKPGGDCTVQQKVADCEGIDIHAKDEHSRLVITMEAATSREVMKLTDYIQGLDGVLHLTPVYQHCEENKQEQQQQGGWKWR
ncbi:MAG: chaperone NapD [Mariprofundaceae bacterium]